MQPGHGERHVACAVLASSDDPTLFATGKPRCPAGATVRPEACGKDVKLPKLGLPKLLKVEKPEASKGGTTDIRKKRWEAFFLQESKHSARDFV
jgi:hypothetical protein